MELNEGLRQRKRKKARENRRLGELALRPNPFLEISHYRLDQFLNLFSLFKRAKRNAEVDFEAGEINRFEMKTRLLNAKKPLRKAAEKVIRCRQVGIKKPNEMESLADLLDYWAEMGGSRRRSRRVTAIILSEDERVILRIELIARNRGIRVREL